MNLPLTYLVQSCEPEEPGFVAFCAEIPEANGQGETEAEAIADLEGSIAFAMQCRREEAIEELSPSTQLRAG